MNGPRAHGHDGGPPDRGEAGRDRAALAREAARFRSVVDPLADGIVIVDESGTIVFHNPAAAGFLGAGRDDELDGLVLGLPLAPGDPVDLDLIGGRVVEMRVVDTVWDGRACQLASLRDVTELKTAERAAREVAAHDALTGLPNRSLLLDRVRQLLAHLKRYPEGPRFALIYMDLDGFKQINDTLGHTTADELLVAFADRISRSLRPSDTIARLGGDEFSILLTDIHDANDAAHAAERILRLLAEPFTLGVRSIWLAASLGVTVVEDARREAADLLQDADQALYSAKAAGRGTFRIFDNRQHEQSRRRLQLEQRLHAAVADHAFDIEFQPIVDLSSGGLVSVEALARWPADRSVGEVLPETFIPLAEEVGLIGWIDRWVLQKAAGRLGGWRRRRPWTRQVELAVNLSRVEFLDPDLVERIVDALGGSGVAPSDVWVEVGEDALGGAGRTVAERVQDLRAAGIRVAIDEFGTGASSLARLEEAPVDGLKIAGRFVRQEDPRMAQAIIALAAHLGLRVVAKGIETSEQARRMATLGCRYGQGYHLGRPMSAAAVAELLGADEQHTAAIENRRFGAQSRDRPAPGLHPGPPAADGSPDGPVDHAAR